MALYFIGGCSAAKVKPPVAVPLAPADVRLDPISDNRAILKYDRGEGVEAEGQAKAEEAMSHFCNARKYKIMVEGERQSGEKKWTRIIVFECIEAEEPKPATSDK